MAVDPQLEERYTTWRATYDGPHLYEELDWDIILTKQGEPLTVGRVEREQHRTAGGYRCWQAFYTGSGSPVTDSLFGAATKDVAARAAIRAYWLHTLGWKHQRICRAIQGAVAAHDRRAPLDEVEPWLWSAR